MAWHRNQDQRDLVISRYTFSYLYSINKIRIEILIICVADRLLRPRQHQQRGGPVQVRHHLLPHPGLVPAGTATTQVYTTASPHIFYNYAAPPHTICVHSGNCAAPPHTCSSSTHICSTTTHVQQRHPHTYAAPPHTCAMQQQHTHMQHHHRHAAPTHTCSSNTHMQHQHTQLCRSSTSVHMMKHRRVITARARARV